MIWQDIINKYYESGSRLREILIRHSKQVCDKALQIVDSKNISLDRDLVIDAAMLHDIGIFRTYAPSIYCNGDQPYICHGIIGASLLRENGVDERIAGVALRHTGAGITRDDIIKQGMPLPLADYVPKQLLEQLICYADKFFSKSGDMQEKPLDVVRESMRRHGVETLQRFDLLHSQFA